MMWDFYSRNPVGQRLRHAQECFESDQNLHFIIQPHLHSFLLARELLFQTLFFFPSSLFLFSFAFLFPMVLIRQSMLFCFTALYHLQFTLPSLLVVFTSWCSSHQCLASSLPPCFPMTRLAYAPPLHVSPSPSSIALLPHVCPSFLPSTYLFKSAKCTCPVKARSIK